MSSHRATRLAWRQFCRRWRAIINAALTLALAGVLVAPGAVSAAPRCPGGQPDGRGGCVYVNPAPARPSRYPSVAPQSCGTKLVAGVAVRHCAYPPMPAFRRPTQ